MKASIREVEQRGEHWAWQPGRDGKVWLLMFWCPGCSEPHGVPVRGSKTSKGGDGWEWNESEERPTLLPSVVVQSTPFCHSFVRDGQIQFLEDCQHGLRGQTVTLPAYD